jgi:hypothetical protein
MLFNTFVPVIALLAIHGTAAPAPAPNPQGLDFDLIAALPPAPTPTIAVGVAAQTIKVNVASMIKSVAQAVSTNPIAVNDKKKRQVTSTCTGGTPQPTGALPASSPDTPDSFSNNLYFGQQALDAATPAGYRLTFQNFYTAETSYYYLGFETLSSYSPATCAAACNGISTCSSFNICKYGEYGKAPAVNLAQTLKGILWLILVVALDVITLLAPPTSS